MMGSGNWSRDDVEIQSRTQTRTLGWCQANCCIHIQYETCYHSFSSQINQEFLGPNMTATLWYSKKEITKEFPEPLGKEVVLTSFVDAHFYHDLTTGRAEKCILHLVYRTPIEWYTKLQQQ